MLNIIQIKGTLNETKGILKQKLALILHDDSLLSEGKKDEILGRIQIIYLKVKNNPYNYHSIPCGLQEEDNLTLFEAKHGRDNPRYRIRELSSK
jgi:uncharacterized protein YjbJ (UPF0337 family)